MKYVIGLAGAKTAGKTTAFNVIKDICDVDEITLAGKLKLTCSKTFNIPLDYFDNQDLKEKELKDLVFLNQAAILSIYDTYGLDYDYSKHVRPHIGKILDTPRRIAQYVGTEMLREFSEDIHCDHAILHVSKDIGVVTDMRFPNELAYFAKKYPNFQAVYIKRNSSEQLSSADTHKSEKGLVELAKKANFVIPNNGSIEEFKRLVADAISRILKEGGCIK